MRRGSSTAAVLSPTATRVDLVFLLDCEIVADTFALVLAGIGTCLVTRLPVGRPIVDVPRSRPRLDRMQLGTALNA